MKAIDLLILVSLGCNLGFAVYSMLEYFRHKKRKAALQAQLDKEFDEAKEKAEQMGNKLAEAIRKATGQAREVRDSDADRLREEVHTNARRLGKNSSRWFYYTNREGKC